MQLSMITTLISWSLDSFSVDHGTVTVGETEVEAEIETEAEVLVVAEEVEVDEVAEEASMTQDCANLAGI